MPSSVTKRNHNLHNQHLNTTREKVLSSSSQNYHQQHQQEQEDQYHPSNSHHLQNNKSNHKLAPVPSVCVRVPHSPTSVGSDASFGNRRREGASSPLGPTTPTATTQFETLEIDIATAAKNARECACHCTTSSPTDTNTQLTSYRMLHGTGCMIYGVIFLEFLMWSKIGQSIIINIGTGKNGLIRIFKHNK